MFGWRRRNEGFEWREYVRTTILVRRADRQRRLDDARMAALAKVKNVADAGADAGRAGVTLAGSQLAKFFAFIGEALLDLAVAGFHIAIRWAKFALAVLSDALGGVAGPLLESLRVPAKAARQKLEAVPDLARALPIKPRHLLTAAGALAVIYFGGPVLRSADGVAVATFTPQSTSSVSVTSEISGRATAVTGDRMRVEGTLVRLDGVEAPASRQPCYRQNGRRWSCASAARSGLNKIIRGRAVTCTQTGNDESGTILARCTVDGAVDVGSELVRNGHVFATGSLFASLSSKEDEARSAKAGIWQGEVARPQEWRDQAWQEAKRAAPEGCPIKGIVRASSKFYALPWSDDYAGAKVRADRGERWFCSEDEAKAAGFMPSRRS